MKNLILLFLCMPVLCSAAVKHRLYGAPKAQLSPFRLLSNTQMHQGLQACIGQCKRSIQTTPDTLVLKNKGQLGATTYQRYQQFHHGIPVIAGQVTISQARSQNPRVNGQLIETLNINTQPKLSAKMAEEKARSQLSHTLSSTGHLTNIKNQLQIRLDKNNQAQLIYQLIFSSSNKQGMPSQPVILIDANNGARLKQWNNIQHQHFDDIGPGGNEKVHEYWYGLDGLPPLQVDKQGDSCVMDNGRVKLVNMHQQIDGDEGNLEQAYQYPCQQNKEDYVNGAYSPINDAYFFGGLIIDMYQNWYHTHALQLSDGSLLPLIMRVHYSEHYDNAFWDGRAMTFGDGDDFYPLVSLDIAGHEVSHGYTQQHANLEYHDVSGSLNESFSDMAGLTVRAYLLATSPDLHKKVYDSATLSFGLGETIIKDNDSTKALRYMDQPSKDGDSADCVNRALAEKTGQQCQISYREMYDKAIFYNSDPEAPDPSSPFVQSFIVHHGSGVFNKAFYLLAQDLGVKRSFALFLRANTQYWGPRADFDDAACGVLQAAKDEGENLNSVTHAFNGVGIDVSYCDKH